MYQIEVILKDSSNNFKIIITLDYTWDILEVVNKNLERIIRWFKDDNRGRVILLDDLEDTFEIDEELFKFKRESIYLETVKAILMEEQHESR
jgi:hypothetical protein